MPGCPSTIPLVFMSKQQITGLAANMHSKVPPQPQCVNTHNNSWQGFCLLSFFWCQQKFCRFFLSRMGSRCFVKLNEKQGNLCGFMVTACFDPVVCSLTGLCFQGFHGRLNALQMFVKTAVYLRTLGKLIWLLDLKHLNWRYYTIKYILSRWFQPLWKICSSNWIISPGRDENQ